MVRTRFGQSDLDAATRTHQAKSTTSCPVVRKMHGDTRIAERYRTGDFVFTGYRGVALDQKAVRVLLRNMDVRVTPHGFRSSFRNWAFHTRQERDLAELSLGHSIAGKTEGAYLTEDGLEERRPLVAAWARYIG